jgi:hypothetical protein
MLHTNLQFFVGLSYTLEGKQVKVVPASLKTPCNLCSCHSQNKSTDRCFSRVEKDWNPVACISNYKINRRASIQFRPVRETSPGRRALPSDYLKHGKRLYAVEIPDGETFTGYDVYEWTVSKGSILTYKEDPNKFSICPDFTTRRAAEAFISHKLDLERLGN